MSQWKDLKRYLGEMIRKIDDKTIGLDELICLNYCKDMCERGGIQGEDEFQRILALGFAAHYALRETTYENECKEKTLM